MKKIMMFFFLLAELIKFEHSIGSVGCMDNSYRLKKEFDTKRYHYVECHCPCDRIHGITNKCLSCGHFHEYKPLIILTSKKANLPKNKVITQIDSDTGKQK